MLIVLVCQLYGGFKNEAQCENVLIQDGAVQQMNTTELDTLCELSDDNGSVHFLVPK